MSQGKIDGSSIAEQLIAGAVIVGVTVAVTHMIDTAKEKKRKKERTR